MGCVSVGHAGTHFTELSSLSMKAFTRAAFVLALACVAASTAHASDADWMDVEGRIQYGFYTEDSRARGAVVSQLSGTETDDPIHHYYVGFANYRQSMVLAGKDKNKAR